MEITAYQSIPAIIRENARIYGNQTAITYNRRGAFLSLSYAQFYERILLLARGLQKVGIRPGERIAIFSENRLGWAISDFGIQCALGITVPIYATNTGMQAAEIINHSESRIVFLSTRNQYEKLLAVRNEIPGVELVISYEGFIGERSFPAHTQYQLSELSTPLSPEIRQQIEQQIDGIKRTDTLTIIYTSGTTGTPKGVVLSHDNILSNIQHGLARMGEHIGNNETFLSFLPLSHVLERTCGYYATLIKGNHIAFAQNINTVMENMTEIRPTIMVSVPRLFEKLHSRIFETVHQASPLKRRLFHTAIRYGRRYVHLRYVRLKRPSLLLRLQHSFFDRLIFRPLRDLFGGRLKFFLCGGAPLDQGINEFMWAIGLPVLNGYGLTETSPMITVPTLDEVRFESVGKPLAETTIHLAEDGELLIRGPQVMQGYYHDTRATAEALYEGWFKTGDIARIDAEGFVYIVDRKKEIIVTAGGKNIAPQPLENHLKLDKYISQAMVFGDRKPYLVALLCPNLERLLDFARQERLNYIDLAELTTLSRVQRLYQERIDTFNASLPPYQTIKHFALIPQDFSIEGGELTPTLKLKRREIYGKYKEVIEELYANHHNGAPELPQPPNGGTRV
jgi:long-chain acyl-CoA synthetase